MQKHLLLVSYLVIFLYCQQAAAQVRSQFQEDPEHFPAELRNFMGRSLNEEQSENMEVFLQKWDAEDFNRQTKEFVLNTANTLRSRNARPVPHFINLLETILIFSESEHNRGNFDVWREAFTSIAGSNDFTLSGINDFLTSTRILISNNFLFKSGALTWKTESKDFSMAWDDSLRVIFGNTNLIAFNHTDTLKIAGTQGVFYPEQNSWEGRGGRVNWDRGGLGQGEAWAILDKYGIDLARSEYSVDSVLFSYNRYLSSPMTGRLTDRLMATSNRDNTEYPRFVSYGQDLTIDGIYNGVDYEGGISMRGGRLIGSGDETRNAKIHFHLNGERWLTAESLHFVFRPGGMTSISAGIFFTLENDTVYHPDMQLNFIDHSRELSVTNNQKVISQSPWLNRFHNVDMTFSRLVWNIDEPVLRFTLPRAGSIGNASFESLDLFDRNRYERLHGMSLSHPLATMRNFASQYNSAELPAEDYSKFLRRSLPEVRRQLLELTIEGFIFYDTETDIFRLRPRLHHYLQANARRIDYDIISFESRTEAPEDNAVLNLATNDLTINGIPRVHISNTQNVDILPGNNTLIMNRNRNFVFEGTVNAGNLSFFGTNFAFDYDKFSINLQNVDSIKLRARLEERDAYGRFLLTQVTNIIRDVTGDLVIDRPFNKSGRAEIPEYPKFTSTGNSYVFYDMPYIQGGVYKSENFYFELEPFLMDSLNSFRNEDLNFRGKLVSAGIFPDLDGELILQDDFSLGMSHSLPENGIAAYGDKGTFYHDISLDNQGLRGSGRLDFLTAELFSAGFFFFPDSLNVFADEFIIHQQVTGTEFPAVRSAGNMVKWLPHDDKMTISQTDNKFNLFRDKAMLDGHLVLRSSGLSGAGEITMENASISSDDFNMGSESFNADNSNILLQMPDRPVILSANGISSNIDISTRRGAFHRAGDAEEVRLPLSGYISNPNSVEWNMDEQRLVLASEAVCPHSGRRGAKYISTGRGQDSLYFISPYAVLDYSRELLSAEGVEYIEVADATVHPGDETVVIAEGSDILPLQGANLITGSGEIHHEIYDANITIESRYSYTGSGFYDYHDEQDRISQIGFGDISVNADTITVASGEIPLEDNFMLSPRFSFKGTAELEANRQLLSFSGMTGIMHECKRLNDQWIAFNTTIDPLDVLIPVPEQPLSEENERIYSGIFIATDSVHIYPAFFSHRRNWADEFIITANGYMKYDNLAGEYRITTLERHRDPGVTENILKLDPEMCIISGEGPLELGVDLGQVRINGLGRARNEVEENETTLEGVVMIDFFLSDEALSHISAAADSLTGEPVDSSSWYYERGLDWILGKEKAELYKNQEADDGNTSGLPAELERTFVLSDIKLVWNKESRSYRSHGPIAIASIGDTPVNKRFTGYLEVTKRRSGDFADLYIELDENTWYYFGYTRGTMQTYSSDREYLRIIEETPLRHRRMNVPLRETRYVYMLATDTKMEQFFRVYRQHLEGRTLVVPGDEDDEGNEGADQELN